MKRRCKVLLDGIQAVCVIFALNALISNARLLKRLKDNGAVTIDKDALG
jgi:hypothetical protein